MSPRRRAAAILGATAALLAVAPSAAWAHGLAGRADLPIPVWLFGWGAAAVLVVSFIGLGFLWTRPRLQAPRETPMFRIPVAADVVCGAIGIGLFLLTVVSGFAGSATATSNFAPTFIYVIFWVGLVPLSVAFGDVFAAFSPWRSVARAARWSWPAITTRPLPRPLPYPARLGRWPAVVGLTGFAWLELAYADRADPRILAGLALAYALVQLAGMAVFGIDAWSTRGDAFGVYFGLFARLSPLAVRDRRLVRRPPLSGAPRLPVVAGTVALLCVMIGSTSYDGLESTTLWTKVSPHLGDAFSFLGERGSEEAAATIGLAIMIALIASLYRMGIGGIEREEGRPSDGGLAGDFAHSLIPIAVAYVLAHYFSFLIFQGQAIWALISDPLGTGADIFGTAGRQIDYGVVSAKGIWYFQVAILVVGHVAGLVLAHDRAVARYADARQATRSQMWMLLVMVSFTGLALWLLASINA